MNNRETIYDLDNYSKMSIIQDAYGVEETLSMLVFYLEEEAPHELRTFLNDTIKEGISEGDIE